MRLATILFFLSVLAAPAARAKKAPAPPEGHLFLVGLRAGPITPQPFNALSANVLVNLEALWAPAATGPALFLDFGQTQPTSSGTRTDSRFTANGGEIAYLMTVQDVAFGLGALYRLKLDRGLVPFFGLGMRLHLTKTLVEQRAGDVDLGSHTEQSRRYSVLGRAGVSTRLGPGELGAELNLDFAPVDQQLTGMDNTGFLGFQLSYLFAL